MPRRAVLLVSDVLEAIPGANGPFDDGAPGSRFRFEAADGESRRERPRAWIGDKRHSLG
jgi:hypothetical protein